MGHYSPWRHLRKLTHINLHWTDDAEDLGDAFAWYYVDHDVILMDSRLTQVERRSVLCHEIAHVLRRDEPQNHHLLDAIQELRADQWAARKLIEIRPLGEALAWSTDLEVAADELWVTPDLLEVRLAHLHPSERHYLRRRLANAAEDVPHMGHTGYDERMTDGVG